MKSNLVGNFELGYRNIRLVVDPDSGDGFVDMIPKDGGAAIVSVGINQPFAEAVGVLLHEVYELGLIDLGARYRKTPTVSHESSNFYFFMSHNELGEVHERIGEFLVAVFPRFMVMYKTRTKFGKDKHV